MAHQYGGRVPAQHFAFAFGGAALSFADFDLIFTLFGLTIVIQKRILPAELAKLAKNHHDVQHVTIFVPAMTASHSR